MSRAVEELKQIPFAELIGAPLKAAIESQALAAQTTIDFIKAVGFRNPAAGEYTDIVPADAASTDIGDIRNVTFNYMKKGNNGSESKFELQVPILTITPIPYIRIDEMTIDFEAKLTDSVVDTRTSSTEVIGTTNGSIGSFWSPVKVSFRVSATNKRGSSVTQDKKREYRINIHVKAVQDEMPSGLSKIIDILDEAIKDVPKA